MNLVRQFVPHHVCYLRSAFGLQLRWKSTESQSQKEEEEEVVITIEDEEAKAQREAEIEVKRNKSRLYPDHYAIYHGLNPYPEPVLEQHHYLKYKRRAFGKYGDSSNVDPSVLWPTKDELFRRQEYDALAYPDGIPKMVAAVKERKQKELAERLKREADVLAKVAKIDQWKQDFHAQVRKKNEEALKAKQRKDRLVEEIRRHFGFKIDPRDDRFKEMMEKKEKEEKKLSKAEKQKTRDMKLLAEAQAAEEKSKQAAEEEADRAEADEIKTKKST